MNTTDMRAWKRRTQGNYAMLAIAGLAGLACFYAIGCAAEVEPTAELTEAEVDSLIADDPNTSEISFSREYVEVEGQGQQLLACASRTGSTFRGGVGTPHGSLTTAHCTALYVGTSGSCTIPNPTEGPAYCGTSGTTSRIYGSQPNGNTFDGRRWSTSNPTGYVTKLKVVAIDNDDGAFTSATTRLPATPNTVMGNCQVYNISNGSGTYRWCSQ